MFSRFVNQFKKDDPDERRSFQRRVHGIASRLYPDRIFSLSDDPLTLESDGTVFGLTNLQSKFLLSAQSDADLEELLKAQFDQVFAGSLSVDREIEWSDVQGRLLPQLMPSDFVRSAPVELVYDNFIEGVTLGFVVDSESTYSYVNVESLKKWQANPNTVREVAFENLHQRSQGVEMMAFPGENAFFIVNTGDGFDAVRLLSPEMREVISQHIGSPFYAGIPNRDFLICWSASGDAEFQDKMRQQVSSDFDEQPYPLSRQPLEVSDDDEIRLASKPEPDARAANADLN